MAAAVEQQQYYEADQGAEMQGDEMQDEVRSIGPRPETTVALFCDAVQRKRAGSITCTLCRV